MIENTSLNRLEDWEPCEGGELRQVVWRVKTERRNRDIFKVGGVVVVLLLCAFAATLIWEQINQAGQFDYGGISCKEVKSHLAAFKDHKLDDQQLVESIRIHLEKCPHCGAAFKKMSDSASMSQVASHHAACGGGSDSRLAEPMDSGPRILASGPRN